MIMYENLLAQKKEYQQAWEIRKTNFPSVLNVYKPMETMSVSLSGKQCSLDCAHCGGHYLQAMHGLDELASFTGKSCLISGGCSPQGKVGVSEHLMELQRLKGDKRYNFHVGLLTEAEIINIAPLADAVSFDLVGATETVQEVFGIPYTAEDYQQCYLNLRKHIKKVIPHICIGLQGGVLNGEYAALEFLRAHGCDSLTFIVLIPTKGTRYECVQPPALEVVAEMLCTARKLFPHTELNLGCMRPGGLYRKQLDELAILAGVNGIVQPVRAALSVAEQMGLTIREGKECCSL